MAQVVIITWRHQIPLRVETSVQTRTGTLHLSILSILMILSILVILVVLVIPAMGWLDCVDCGNGAAFRALGRIDPDPGPTDPESQSVLIPVE